MCARDRGGSRGSITIEILERVRRPWRVWVSRACGCPIVPHRPLQSWGLVAVRWHTCKSSAPSTRVEANPMAAAAASKASYGTQVESLSGLRCFACPTRTQPYESQDAIDGEEPMTVNRSAKTLDCRNSAWIVHRFPSSSEAQLHE